MTYGQLTRCILPLILTLVVQGLSGQFLSGGMARVPRATQVLASYGLAWGLVDFLASPLSQVRQLGLVLAQSRSALRRLLWFVLACAAGLSGVLLLLALTRAGVWVVEDLHGVGAPLSGMVLQALLWLAPLPVLEGANRFYSGLLLRFRRTGVVSAATLAHIGVSIAAVFALLPAPFVQAQPIWLPILVTYAGAVVETGVVLWGYRRCVGGELPAAAATSLGWSGIVSFFWPLALIMAIQGGSRPLINLFVSRGADGVTALAVLAVVYPLGNLPYGWVNEIRSLPAAFQGERGSLRAIRRFAVACGLASFAIMLGMFWTPLRHYLLEELIGVAPEMAALCLAPLMVFSFFPLVVAVRAYFHGVALLERRTRILAPSAPARIGIIVAALLLLPEAHLSGATRGVVALLAGFVLEALLVWWGVRGWSPRAAPEMRKER